MSDEIIEVMAKLNKNNVPYKREYVLEAGEIVNKPMHYMGKGGMEVVDVIESFELNWHKGSAIKYLLRAGKKDEKKYVQDLQKAVWCLTREIKEYQKRQGICQ